MSAREALISDDGRYVASKNSATVWELSNGFPISKNFASEKETSAQSVLGRRIVEQNIGLVTRNDPSTALSFGPDNNNIYTADSVGNIFIWSATASSHVNEIELEEEVFDMGVAPDGKNIMVASFGKLISWDLKQLVLFKESKRLLLSTEFGPDGEQIAYASGVTMANREPSGLHIFNFPSNSSNFYPFDSKIRTMDFGKNSIQLAVGASTSSFQRSSKDSGLTLLNTQNGARRKFNTDEITIYQVKLHPTRPWIAYAGGFGSKIFDIESKRLILETGWAKGLDFSDDGRFIALHNRDTVWVLKIDPHKESHTELKRFFVEGEPTTLDFDKTGRYLAIGTGNKGVSVWDWQKKIEIARIPARQSVVRTEFSPSNPRILIVAEKHRLTLNYWHPEDILKQSETRMLRMLTSTEWARYAGTSQFSEEK